MSTPIKWETGYSLAFETSSATGSIALGRADVLLADHEFSRPRHHAVEFLPAVAQLCAGRSVQPSAIRVIFVSTGPGSFTGLRIGVTAARMLALAHGSAVVSVPTLSVIAQNASTLPAPPEKLAVLLDAKRRRVYAAAFSLEEGVYVPVTQPAEVDPIQFLAMQDPACAVMGEGVAYHQDAVESAGRPVLPAHIYPPRAPAVFRLGIRRAQRGLFEDPRTLVPLYVRPPEAEEKRLRRQASQEQA